MHLHANLSFLKNRELDELYLSFAIRSFAISLITIFIPVFLLSLNYPLQAVFSFFVFHSAFHTIGVFSAGYLSTKLGLKHTMLFSIPLLIIFFALLFSLESFGWPLIILGLFSGLHSAHYWVPYHTDFALFSKKKDRGKSLGFASVFASLFSVFGPLIGGLILLFFNFSVLFIIVIFFLFLTVAPFFLSKEVKKTVKVSWKKIFKGHSLSRIIGNFGFGMELKGFGVIWPLFLFLFAFGDFVSLGFITTIMLIFSLISTFLVGYLLDKNRHLIFSISVISVSIIWIIKVFVSSAFQIFILDPIHGITRSATDISADAMTYDHSKNGAVEYMMFREFFLHLGGATIMLILVIIPNLKLGMVLVALGGILMLLLNRK